MENIILNMGEMKKEIKDYLHLYMGCDCQDEDGRKGWLSGFDVCERDYSITMLTMRYPDSEDDYQVFNDNEQLDRIKLLLRPLSSMTEEETIEFKKLIPFIDFVKFESGNRWKYIEHEDDGNHQTRAVCITTAMIGTIPMVAMPFLLSKGFDLFDLIKSGLALDKTKQP